MEELPPPTAPSHTPAVAPQGYRLVPPTAVSSTSTVHCPLSSATVPMSLTNLRGQTSTTEDGLIEKV